MSDTDDTDALLASDPGGGLEMFMGLSLKELADKHKNIITKTSTSAATVFENTVDKNSNADSTLTNLEDLETSDFFNSQGELVLSGLSEWTDSDDDIQSEAGSEASFTFEGVPKLESKSIEEKNQLDLSSNNKEDQQQEKEEEEIIDERDREIVIDTSKPQQHHRVDPVTSSFRTFLDMSFGRTPSMIPRNQNFGRVVDINLLKPATGWNIPLPNHSTGQVFTRAPNFRTPGGYKPSSEPEDYRDLTEEEIREEVLNMYAFPDEVIDQTNENSNPPPPPPAQNNPPKVSFASTEAEIINGSDKSSSPSARKKSAKNQRASKVRFDFVNGDTPTFGSEAGVVADEKAVKRKHLISAENGNVLGAGDCAVAEGSGGSESSSVRFSMEENSDASAKSKSSRAAAKKVTYSTKVVRGKRSAEKKKSSGFSFGYGESESELSPIKGLVGGDVFNTPGSVSGHSQQSSSSSSVPYSLAELKTVWRDIQERKHALEENNRRQVGVSEVATAKESTTAESRHSMSQSKDLKNSPRANSSHSQLSASSMHHSLELDHKYLPLLESFASDLESILQEADINPDEFEDIIDNLQIGSNMTNLVSEIPNFTKQFDGIEYDQYDGSVEPSSDTAAQAELSDWAKSGAVEYVEKYQEERLRRDQCEIEIQKLQKELLEIKQRNAVLEGKMKKKDTLLFQITSSWNKVSKEWKAHEAMSQAALTKLEKEQKDLMTACKEGKERISQYEQELMKTVELADSFKSKIVEVEDAKTIAIMRVEEEKRRMAEIIGRMEKDVDDLKNEKETALRALKESQSQLDERTSDHDKIQSELLSLEEHANQNAKRFEFLAEQKKTLESHLETVTLRKSEVENELQTLTQELETVRMEKEDLRRNLEDSAARQVKEEGDRLHDYYNNKVQEVLKSATEKAAKAEVTLMNSMRKSNNETEKKLKECRERHHIEVTRLKSKYESELQELMKENQQKQLLITTTAQQLHSGELARSSAVDRLQTIVSSMPETSIAERTNNNKAQRRGSENSALQTAQSNIQYSKFTQSLNTFGQNRQLEASQSIDSSGLRLLNSSTRVGDSHILEISRYNKTSTPITSSELFTQSSNQSCPSKDNVLSIASKLCKYFETTNSNLVSIPESRMLLGTNNYNFLNHIQTNIGLEQQNRRVQTPKLEVVQVMKSVDPLLETPVRLQKENGLPAAESPNNNNPADLEALIDPALHKCLEELMKRYAQKQDVIQTQKDSSASVQIKSAETNSAAVQLPIMNKVKTEKVNSCGEPASENDNSSSSKHSNVKKDKDSCKDKDRNQTSSKRPWK